MEIRLGVVAAAAEQPTRLVAMPNTAEAAVLEAMTMTLVGQARLVVPAYSVEAVAVQDCATAEQQSEGLEEHGDHILLAAEEQVGKATQTLATLEHPENLGLVMAEAEVSRTEQVEEMVEPHLVAEVVLEG